MFQGERDESDNGWSGYGGPWPYTILDEPDLSHHVERLSGHKSIGAIDHVSFQPYPSLDHNQDRSFTEDWLLNGQSWRFLSIFDGHSGHDTVEHTVRRLPAAIKQNLLSKLDWSKPIIPMNVSEVLKHTISTFDDEITQGLLDLFPGGAETLAHMSDEDIRAIAVVDGQPHPKIALSMTGTTVLLALIDSSRNLYVASLGDCLALLGRRDGSSGDWNTTILSSNHNGQDDKEVQRIRTEHPGEDECIQKARVLGVIAVTRAIGDQAFKLPAVFPDRVFRIADPSAHILTRLEVLLPRLLTPPYLSNIPDIQHVYLGDSSPADTVLLMASDGLIDVSKAHDQPLADIAPRWMGVAAKNMDNKPALRVLRDAMGGEDRKQVSFWLTVEMDSPWVDDTTIIVTSV